jgi:hypothetical protein
MAYFTNSQGYLFLCSDIPFEEKQKLDDYLQLLEDSGVGKIIEQAMGKHSEKGGRPSYNPYAKNRFLRFWSTIYRLFA